MVRFESEVADIAFESFVSDFISNNPRWLFGHCFLAGLLCELWSLISREKVCILKLKLSSHVTKGQQQSALGAPLFIQAVGATELLPKPS